MPVNDDARMVLEDGRHGPAEAVAAGSDLAGNDGNPARESPLRTAQVAETALRAVPAAAVQREDHRKPGMAVENGAPPRVLDDQTVGGKLAGSGDPRTG
jgi:hypothetical protein